MMSIIDYFKRNREPEPLTEDDVTNLTVGRLCEIIGVSSKKIPKDLVEQKLSFVAVHYSWVVPGSAYFSRYVNKKEEDSARKAVARGAVVLFTTKKFKSEDGKPLPCIIVKKPSELFYRYYACMKKMHEIPTLAITGSVGKTTTKDMLSDVASKKYKVMKNNGNANSHNAMGSIIRRLTPEHEFYIQEVGAFAPGWVEGAAKMLQPDMCLITNVGYPHIDLYGSIENIFADKTSLIRHLPDDGVAFLNYDDDRLRRIKTKKKIISFAIHHEADYKAENVQEENGIITFDLHCAEGVYNITIHMHGVHNVLNALAAFAVGRYIGINATDIVKALYDYRSEGLRQNVQNIGGYNLYMDCYNSAPNSILTSLESLSKMEVKDGCKRIAVLGDIPRLGSTAPEIHRETGEKIKNADIEQFLLYGPHCKTMSEAMEGGSVPVFYAEDREQLNEAIRKTAGRGDYILFKAGHPTGLAKTVDQVFGTSFHLTDGDVLIEDAHDASDENYRARWIDGAIEIRGAKKKEYNRILPETTDGETPVIRTGNNSFAGGIMNELTLPDTLKMQKPYKNQYG